MDYFHFGIGLCLSGFPFFPIYRWLACWRHFLCPLSCLFSSYQLCSLLKAQQTERGKKTSIFYEGKYAHTFEELIEDWEIEAVQNATSRGISASQASFRCNLASQPRFDSDWRNSILSNMLKTITAKISIFICRSSSSCSPYFSLIFLSFVWKVKKGYD